MLFFLSILKKSILDTEDSDMTIEINDTTWGIFFDMQYWRFIGATLEMRSYMVATDGASRNSLTFH